METTNTAWPIHEGTTVYAADGDKVGKVTAIGSNYFVVEKGFFFPTDYYVPTSAIASADDDGDNIYLNVSKDATLTSGWHVQPTDAGWNAGATGYADTTGYAGTSAGTATDDVLRVPVHEEELAATKRPVEQGQVRIAKDVVEEERTLDVPVTEERVRVTRHVVDRAGTAGEDAFTEGTIEVPVRGEQVELEKRVRVAEEVEVGKEAVQRTERVGGTVRREEVRVDDQTVDADTGTTNTGA